MTPARRAQVYASQTGGLMTARQMRRYRKQILRRPGSVATLPATEAPREGQSAVHAPTVAVRTCIQAAVGASLGEVTP